MAFRITATVVLVLSPCLAAAGEVVAHWPMEAIEEGVLKDTSGNGHDGTYFGSAPPQETEGIARKALEFDSEGEGGFEIAGSDAFNFSGAFSVMAWVKPKARHGTGEVLCFKGDKSGDPPWPGWRLRYFWSRAGFEFGTTDGRQFRIDSPEWSVPAGFWSHVAATYDGETVRIYVNAVLAVEAPVEGIMAPQKRPAILANYVGRKDAYPFDGSIDDVKVFAGCLSEEDVFAEAVRGMG